MAYLNDASQWQATSVTDVINSDVTVTGVVFDSFVVCVIVVVTMLVVVGVAARHLLNELLQSRTELLLFRVTEAEVERLEDNDSERLNQLTEKGLLLKLKLSQYPAMHTNRMLYICTTLQ